MRLTGLSAFVPPSKPEKNHIRKTGSKPPKTKIMSAQAEEVFLLLGERTPALIHALEKNDPGPLHYLLWARGLITRQRLEMAGQKQSPDKKVFPADVNSPNAEGKALLLRALEAGNRPNAAQKLLNGGADPESRNRLGEPLEVTAIRKGYPELVKALIPDGSYALRTDRNGRTPLHHAFLANTAQQKEIVAYLLEITPVESLEIQDALGRTSLMEAIKSGHYEQALRLIKAMNPSGLNLQDQSGKTALMEVAPNPKRSRGAIEVIRALLDQGANVNSKDNQGRTALMLAAWNQSMDSLIELLRPGTNIHSVDSQGKTALIYAAMQRQPDWESNWIIHNLIRAGASANWQENKGRTALMYATHNGSFELISKLSRESDNLDARDHAGNTALMYAVAQGNWVTARDLLLRGAGANARNNNGKTVWKLAEESKDTQMLKVFRYLQGKNNGNGNPIRFNEFNGRRLMDWTAYWMD